MSIIQNPFLSNKNITHYDNTTNESVILTQLNVAKYYKEVYVLCKRNSDKISSEFYDFQMSKDVYNNVTNNLIIDKFNIKILLNKFHFDNIIQLSDEQLKPFNIFNHKLESKNLVLPIFNICYKNLISYFNQYVTTNNLQTIYNLKVLNKYFNLNETKKIKDNLENIICNLEESNYWTNYYNTLINNSDKFINRSIHFQSNRMVNRKIAAIINKIIDMPIDSKTISKTTDYIRDIDIESKKDDDNDITKIITNKGTSLYRINSECEFDKNDINQLFSVLDKKQQFLLFAHLVISKKYCHLVINNEYILDLMQETIHNFAPLFRYLFSYAWIRFYIEENIKNKYMKVTDPFIFDINTASKLPVFPFNHDKPKENPYMPLLIADTELKSNQNVCGVLDYSTKENNLGGIADLTLFKRRLNIFCTGNPNNNLFENVDFTNIAITGSIMSACLQKYHPCMSIFAKCDNIDLKVLHFFNEYYAKSDIDIIIKISNIKDYIDQVYSLYNQILLNICKFNNDANPDHIHIKLNKSGWLFVSEEFIHKNIHFDHPVDDKIKYVFDNINDPLIHNKFKPFYDKLLNDYINNTKQSSYHDDMLNFDNVEFKVYLNKHHENSYHNKDIDLSFSYKYNISSPYLLHSLEIFNIFYNDYFSTISTFHLPCVRSYYNGNNVFLTPSCISAHLTFMNLDYKYMTGTKDPLDIINKNRMRGFGTWLNKNEKEIFTKYCNEVPFWNNLYGQNIFGPLSLNHKVFRPRLYNMDEYIDCNYIDTNNRYIDTFPSHINFDLFQNISKCVQDKFGSHPIDVTLTDINAIDKDGYITPIKKWIIPFIWELNNYPIPTKSINNIDNKPTKPLKKPIKQQVIVSDSDSD